MGLNRSHFILVIKILSRPEKKKSDVWRIGGSTRGEKLPPESSKTVRFIDKTHMGIRHAGNRIKPVENEDFEAPFSKMAPINDQKALAREGFRNALSQHPQIL